MVGEKKLSAEDLSPWCTAEIHTNVSENPTLSAKNPPLFPPNPGVLEKAQVLSVILDAMLRGATSAVRLVFSTLVAAYMILLGTGSQMLAVIVSGQIGRAHV